MWRVRLSMTVLASMFCIDALSSTAAGDEGGAETARQPLRVSLTAKTVRRGSIVFLQATARATNVSETDVWITKRRSARIWSSSGVPWIFKITLAGSKSGDGKASVHWLCRINERLARPTEYGRLSPGQTIEVELPFPCARLVEAGRYLVVARFHDEHPPPSPSGTVAVKGPVETVPLEIEVTQ
jgi:hypothetical protein